MDARSLSFTHSSEDLAFYADCGVPPPTLSPMERQRRRTAFRNFRNLYRRKCDATGKSIISMYREDVPFPVFDKEFWWTDGWDPAQYGLSIDFSKPFFEQYQALSNRVPRYHVINIQSENCLYANAALQSKSCHLVFGVVRSEDCLYGHIVWECKDCIDCTYAYKSTLCTNSLDIVECYGVHYSEEVMSSAESYFLYDCIGCKNCFGGVGLRFAEYVFFNEQCTKDEYESRLKKLFPLTRDAIHNMNEWLRYAKAHHTSPKSFERHTENVFGNHNYEGRNLFYSFDSKRCEDAKYIFTALDVSNSYDISFTGGPARFCYEGMTLHNTERVMFSQLVSNLSDSVYCEFCTSGSDLFGCNGIRNKSNVILNKPYSKHEFDRLKARLISHMRETGEWGEYFPISLSPFYYEETAAGDYLPLQQGEIVKRGGKSNPDYKRVSNSENEKLTAPEDASEGVCDRIFHCSLSGAPFKFEKIEVERLSLLGLPLPCVSPEGRYLERLSRRAPRRIPLKMTRRLD